MKYLFGSFVYCFISSIKFRVGKRGKLKFGRGDIKGFVLFD